jgi:hypothetical protein
VRNEELEAQSLAALELGSESSHGLVPQEPVRRREIDQIAVVRGGHHDPGLAARATELEDGVGRQDALRPLLW